MGGTGKHSRISAASSPTLRSRLLPQAAIAQVEDIIHAYRLLASTSDLTAWPDLRPISGSMFSFGLDALRRGAKTSCALVARAGT